MTPVLTIADYLLLKGQKGGIKISNKKLQKLLYYVQAWSLALNDEQVFSEKIEAWVHGPAIKSVYLEFQKFGANPIEKQISEDFVKDIPGNVISLIDQVWEVYSGLDANYLEYLTHSESPWKEARQNLEPHESSENEITLKSMKDFYSTKITK